MKYFHKRNEKSLKCDMELSNQSRKVNRLEQVNRLIYLEQPTSWLIRLSEISRLLLISRLGRVSRQVTKLNNNIKSVFLNHGNQEYSVRQHRAEPIRKPTYRLIRLGEMSRLIHTSRLAGYVESAGQLVNNNIKVCFLIKSNQLDKIRLRQLSRLNRTSRLTKTSRLSD